MIEMTREEILTLYKEGGFLAESAPFHDWWKYDADYKPAYEPGGSLARMIEPDVPRQMKEAGELEIAYGDTFAKMYVYKLSNNAVLHAAGLDPDEVGAQMKQAAEEALARVKPQKGEDDAADLRIKNSGHRGHCWVILEKSRHWLAGAKSEHQPQK
jgi:hypothetical protein